ncbi:MAG: serine/threonine-protein kinase [Fuerstiella sp.]
MNSEMPNPRHAGMADSKTVVWQQIQDLFAEAVELPAEKQAEFLRRECGNDLRLREEVSSLLNAFCASGDTLENSPIDLTLEVPMLSVARDAVAGYEIRSEIHRGGQGVVYRALQLGTKREVALKFMLCGPFASHESRRRFQREVEVVSQLRHPGIVPIFDSGEADRQPYYVMEYVPGLRLQDFVKHQQPGVTDILKLMALLCDAVGFAHQQKVVHRDLKPSNIMVTKDGEPRVLDFGLAKLATADSDTMALSISGQVMGTLAYMSPEHASGKSDSIDTRSDVYSLGVILYELLADQLPYVLEQSIANNLNTIRTAEPVDLHSRGNHLPLKVCTIVGKALSKDKARRYQDATGFAADIRRYLSGDAIEARSDSKLYVLKKKTRPYIFQIALAFALFCGVIVGILASGIAAGDPAIAPALEPISVGQFYSQDDLDSQLDAIRDLIRQDETPAKILAQFQKRFGNLAANDFDTAMSVERQADLRLILKVRDFLLDNPRRPEIETFVARLQQPPAPGQRTSGLAREIGTVLLQLSAAAAGP